MKAPIKNQNGEGSNLKIFRLLKYHATVLEFLPWLKIENGDDGTVR
jgi:hypothetical protein